MKRCPACRRLLALEECTRNRSSRDGRSAYCRPCHNRKMREGKARLYGSERSYHLIRRYGITAEQRDLMEKVQRGRCAICKVEGKKLHVDHDHGSGFIRGLLCFNCNAGLGQIGDSLPRLRKLAAYRRRFA